MPTKSSLKHVHISSRNSAESFLNALEAAERNKGKPVKMSQPFTEASRTDIRAMFKKT